ncbi:MAG: hypothetical protein GY797_38795 [Deltaproteobacteria bacterium]|nr:hypothetical protein [Deltaproteobacteria bacterium]
MDDNWRLARIYSLVAQMEAQKAKLERYKRAFPTDGAWRFKEVEEELLGIAQSLEELGHE